VNKPRLRFDRGALGLVDRLQTALCGSVPEGKTVVVTVTAPIRMRSRTAAALQEKIRTFVTARTAPARFTATIHGNQIQVHLLKGGTSQLTKLIGFVHNPDPDPTILIDVTRALLACTGSRPHAGSARNRWLAIANQNALVPIETYRQVCSQLGVRKVFGQTLVVLAGGRITALTG
jgi:hypothetical protein